MSSPESDYEAENVGNTQGLRAANASYLRVVLNQVLFSSSSSSV